MEAEYPNRILPAPDPELPQNLMDVALHRALGYVESPGDLLVA